MRVGVVILCRFSSSRLYGKILKKIAEKETLQYICDKINRISNIDGFCVATSVEKEDDAIEDFCRKRNITIFRGNLNNVSKRFYNCARDNNYDAIVRINGDNIFLDQKLIENSIELFKTSDIDFLSNVKDRTFPKGMSIEIVERKVYKEALDSISNSDYYKEHVMPYFYNNEDKYNVKYIRHGNNDFQNVDLALDTQEDFNLAEKIIHSFRKPHYEYNCDEIVKIYKKIKSEKL